MHGDNGTWKILRKEQFNPCNLTTLPILKGL